MSLPTITLCASHEPGDPSLPVVVSATAQFANRADAELFLAEFPQSLRVRVLPGLHMAHLTVELRDTRGREKTGSKVRRMRYFLHTAGKQGYPFEMRVDDADDYSSPEALRAALDAQ